MLRGGIFKMVEGNTWLILFIGAIILILICWFFGHFTEKIAKDKGIFDNWCWWLGALTWFLGLIVVILIPQKIEKVTIEKKETNKTKAQEIKEYKELFDNGAITEEEYNKLKETAIEN